MLGAGVAIALSPVTVACISPANELRLRVESSRRANAVYHIACLTRSLPCTSEVFEQFWKGQLGWTSIDDAHLGTWRQVTRAATDAARAQHDGPSGQNSPSSSGH